MQSIIFEGKSGITDEKIVDRSQRTRGKNDYSDSEQKHVRCRQANELPFKNLRDYPGTSSTTSESSLVVVYHPIREVQWTVLLVRRKTIRVPYSLLCGSLNGLCLLLYLRRKIASRLGKNGKRVCLPCLSSLTACKLSGQFIIRPRHRTDSIHHCT
jgi:hypothetical protein